MVKKFLYTLINTVSLLIIVAAVAVLVLVLFTPSGQAPQAAWLYDAACHDREHGADVCD